MQWGIAPPLHVSWQSVSFIQRAGKEYQKKKWIKVVFLSNL